jgi:hypothetical protein
MNRELPEHYFAGDMPEEEKRAILGRSGKPTYTDRYKLNTSCYICLSINEDV